MGNGNAHRPTQRATNFQWTSFGLLPIRWSLLSIVFFTLLPEMRREYPIPIQKQNSNQKLMQWWYWTLLKSNKFKQTSNTSQKLWLWLFWDEKGVFLVNFMECNVTIKACLYYKSLNKRCDKLLSGIILLHNNASLHISAKTKKKVQDFL